MDIKIVKDHISLEELQTLAADTFGDMVKAVVDIQTGIMAVGGSMHADCEQVLMDEGSVQENLWGFNIYPGKTGDDFLQYESLINIRPHEGNRSLTIQAEEIKNQIREIVNKIITLPTPLILRGEDK